MTCESPCICFD